MMISKKVIVLLSTIVGMCIITKMIIPTNRFTTDITHLGSAMACHFVTSIFPDELGTTSIAISKNEFVKIKITFKNTKNFRLCLTR